MRRVRKLVLLASCPSWKLSFKSCKRRLSWQRRASSSSKKNSRRVVRSFTIKMKSSISISWKSKSNMETLKRKMRSWDVNCKRQKMMPIVCAYLRTISRSSNKWWPLLQVKRTLRLLTKNLRKNLRDSIKKSNHWPIVEARPRKRLLLWGPWLVLKTKNNNRLKKKKVMALLLKIWMVSWEPLRMLI